MGILQNRIIGFNIDTSQPDKVLVNKIETTKNGNSDGITVSAQSFKPICAPYRAILLSRIKMSMVAHKSKINRMDLDRFIGITSKEFMQPQEKQHQFSHSIFQKEVLL